MKNYLYILLITSIISCKENVVNAQEKKSENIETIEVESMDFTDGVNTDTDIGVEIFYDQEEDKFYLLNSEDEIIKELSEDEIDLEENTDETFRCNIHNLPVIFSE